MAYSPRLRIAKTYPPYPPRGRTGGPESQKSTYFQRGLTAVAVDGFWICLRDSITIDPKFLLVPTPD